MRGQTEQLLEDVLGAVRAVMRPHEAVLTVGRLLAWHALGSSEILPLEFTPARNKDATTAHGLRDVLRLISNYEPLGPRRYAFDEWIHAPYELMSPNSLAVISRTAERLVTLDGVAREQLAAAWADAWFSNPAPDYTSIPLEIADLAVHAVAAIAGDLVHCPGSTVDAVAIACMKHGCVPTGESLTPPVVAAIFAAIAGKEMRVKARMFSLDAPATKTANPEPTPMASKCISVPAWGQRLDPLTRLEISYSRFGARSSEALALELAATGNAKEAVVIVSNGILSSRGPDAALRRHLVEDGTLKRVIGFPPNLLAGSGMPFSIIHISRAVSPAGVTFCKVDEKKHLSAQGKLRSRDRRFVGLDDVLQLLNEPDGKLSRTVSREDIAAQDFLLNPERYLGPGTAIFGDGLKATAPLGDLVSIIKPQFLASDEGDERVEVQEAIPAELPEYGHLGSVIRTRYVNAKALQARRQQVLQPNDVLLSTKGTIGKVALSWPDEGGLPLLPSQASVVLRRKDSSSLLDPRFLVMYLRSPVIQRLIGSLAVGATIQNISLTDLKSLPIWLAKPEEQRPFIDAFDAQARLQLEILDRQARQLQIEVDIWEQAGLLGEEK